MQRGKKEINWREVKSGVHPHSENPDYASVLVNRRTDGRMDDAIYIMLPARIVGGGIENHTANEVREYKIMKLT